MFFLCFSNRFVKDYNDQSKHINLLPFHNWHGEAFNSTEEFDRTVFKHSMGSESDEELWSPDHWFFTHIFFSQLCFYLNRKHNYEYTGEEYTPPFFLLSLCLCPDYDALTLIKLQWVDKRLSSSSASLLSVFKGKLN